MAILELQKTLDRLYEMYRADHLSMDPLEIVRRYDDPADQEIVGFIAAALALGRAELIRSAVEDVLERMRQLPRCFVETFDPGKDVGAFQGFNYRFYREQDMVLLVWWMRQMLEVGGSIGGFFLKGYDPYEEDIGQSLSRFVKSVLTLKTTPVCDALPEKGSGIRHFLADPSDGSGCKRLNLYLRWMVRCDALDLGIWEEVSPAKLIIPLDTHIARLGKRLGLTRRANPDWKMAVEITEHLRRFDPKDPVKYDFALCTVGKRQACPDPLDRSVCMMCPVASCCRAC